MAHPVDHRGGHLVVPEHGRPAAELQVRRDDQRPPLVAVGHHLEQEPGPLGVEGEVSELVDHDHPRPGHLRELAVEPSLGLRAPQPRHQRRRGEEPRRDPCRARELDQRAGHVGLPRAHVAHEHEVLAALQEGQGLEVDELGLLPLDPDGARLLFQVFADAYERQSVVVTTNLEFSRWGSVFGDDQMAAAVIDRIVHHGRLVQFRGESYRVRHALMQEGWALEKPAHVACAGCSDSGAHFAQI